jgi:hypothetical protein
VEEFPVQATGDRMGGRAADEADRRREDGPKNASVRRLRGLAGALPRPWDDPCAAALSNDRELFTRKAINFSGLSR